LTSLQNTGYKFGWPLTLNLLEPLSPSTKNLSAAIIGGSHFFAGWFWDSSNTAACQHKWALYGWKLSYPSLIVGITVPGVNIDAGECPRGLWSAKQQISLSGTRNEQQVCFYFQSGIPYPRHCVTDSEDK
jgi:hypothetical protein